MLISMEYHKRKDTANRVAEFPRNVTVAKFLITAKRGVSLAKHLHPPEPRL